MIVTTDTQVDGYRIASQLGLVRGVATRSMSMFGMYNVMFPFLRRLSESPAITHERNYDTAVSRMVEQATEKGANAIVGVRIEQAHQPPFDNSILAYGTAVVIELAD